MSVHRVIAFSALLLSTRLAASTPPDGILDPGFGNAGLASASFNLTPDFADRSVGMAVAPSGRIYLAATVGVSVQGQTRQRPALARFLGDGQLDTSFSGDGLSSPIPNTLASQHLIARGVLLRADGRPLAYGVRYAGGGARAKAFVCRYAVAGNLDPGFDGDGCAEPSLALIDNGEEHPYTALRLPDERVLLGGYVGVNPLNPDHLDGMLMMLTADGAVDPSFGTSGYVRLQPPGSSFTQVIDLHRLDDGRILIAATADTGSFVARTSASGQLDTQFGSNGYALLSFADLHNLSLPLEWARALGVDSQGRIYLCGNITYGNNLQQSVMTYARLSPNGLLDLSYSSDGRVLRPFIDVFPTSNIVDCSIDAQDRLVAAVHTGTIGPSNGDIGALRLLADGSEDPRFGHLGQTRVAIDLGGNGVGHETLAGMALLGDRLLIAGTAYPANGVTTTGEVHTIIRLGSDRPFADGFE